jgi:uncharacterized protein with PIN domain
MKGDSHKARGTVYITERFFADSMLGKLALWMRIMGYDVAYEKAIEDSLLVKRALNERRIILTRDTLLILRKGVRENSLFIESDHVREQLRQVLSVYGIGKEKFLTRCLRCNIQLEDIPGDSVEARVPPYVFETKTNFSTCPGCGRIYWAGTHRDHMIKEVSKIKGDLN